MSWNDLLNKDDQRLNDWKQQEAAQKQAKEQAEKAHKDSVTACFQNIIEPTIKKLSTDLIAAGHAATNGLQVHARNHGNKPRVAVTFSIRRVSVQFDIYSHPFNKKIEIAYQSVVSTINGVEEMAIEELTEQKLTGFIMDLMDKALEASNPSKKKF